MFEQNIGKLKITQSCYSSSNLAREFMLPQRIKTTNRRNRPIVSLATNSTIGLVLYVVRVYARFCSLQLPFKLSFSISCSLSMFDFQTLMYYAKTQPCLSRKYSYRYHQFFRFDCRAKVLKTQPKHLHRVNLILSHNFKLNNKLFA